jgi:hypothetical protein
MRRTIRHKATVPDAAPTQGFCGNCVKTCTPYVQRPMGRNNAMVWICRECDEEVVPSPSALPDDWGEKS